MSERMKRKTVEKLERNEPEVIAKLRVKKIEDGYAYCEAELVLAGNKENESPAEQD